MKFHEAQKLDKATTEEVLSKLALFVYPHVYEAVLHGVPVMQALGRFVEEVMSEYGGLEARFQAIKDEHRPGSSFNHLDVVKVGMLSDILQCMAREVNLVKKLIDDERMRCSHMHQDGTSALHDDDVFTKRCTICHKKIHE